MGKWEEAREALRASQVMEGLAEELARSTSSQAVGATESL